MALPASQRRAEDAVQYRVFLLTPHGGQGDPPPPETEAKLRGCLERVRGALAPLVCGYIWQEQRFALRVRPGRDGIPAHLYGQTTFGDNVEDEWFVVFLVREITRLIPEAVAWLEDTDGQFLLIEAAHHLPRWLNPDTSENRVFFYRGELHILPLPRTPGDVGRLPVGTPSVESALALLAQRGHDFLADEPIRRAVGKRIDGYPGRARESEHRARCVLPLGVAGVLRRRPGLVAPAVRAFYLREPGDLRACRSFRTFPPGASVLALVTFTRCLYAQLSQQRFDPDRRSGFQLPPPSDPTYREHSLGMKLAHGFEILCSRCALPPGDTGSERPVSSDPRWQTFRQSLVDGGYFKGELQGSRRYRELLQAAETYFTQSLSEPASDEVQPGEEVLLVLREVTLSEEELRHKEETLPPDDDDSWMDLTPDQLDHMLEEKEASCKRMNGRGGARERKQKERKEVPGEEPRGEDSYDLSAVASSMKAFISKVSSLEGAELPRLEDERPVRLDVDAFMAALHKLTGPVMNEEGADRSGSDDGASDDDDDDDDDDLDWDDCDDGDDAEEWEGDDGGAGGGVTGLNDLKGLRDYMEQMDRELAATNVGKSFERQPPAQQQRRGTVGGPAGVHRGQPHTGTARGPGDHRDASDNPRAASSVGADDLRPVDVDLNLVKNLLESFSSQDGLAGPASTLLHSMGLRLPHDSRDDDPS
ncbi:protein ecdysoneless homolog isoform X1 [Petromyzon marinus]|uniref:protein ecdysoneless homolog isoform X1 n=1 Tax=Petromyzon marinus TaxID=7757 RepID=UPI003F71EB63